MSPNESTTGSTLERSRHAPELGAGQVNRLEMLEAPNADRCIDMPESLPLHVDARRSAIRFSSPGDMFEALTLVSPGQLHC